MQTSDELINDECELKNESTIYFETSSHLFDNSGFGSFSDDHVEQLATQHLNEAHLNEPLLNGLHLNEQQQFNEQQMTHNQLVETDENDVMKKMGLPTKFGSKNKMNSAMQAVKKAKQKELLDSKEKRRINNFKKRRVYLFSEHAKFEDVEIDDQMWYSITPEAYAKDIAIYCKKKVDYTVLLDGFCGLGGNLIQFAVNNKNAFIVGIDSCFERVENAKKIAKIYKVENQCDFICGDFTQLATCLQIKPDIVFLSPPWGGLNYKKKKKYLLKHMPIDGSEIFAISKKLTNNIAYYLPRNQCLEDLSKLNEEFSLDFNTNKDFGLTLNVYFGDLVDRKFIVRIEDDLNSFSNLETSFCRYYKQINNQYAGSNMKSDEQSNKEEEEEMIVDTSQTNDKINGNTKFKKNNDLSAENNSFNAEIFDDEFKTFVLKLVEKKCCLM